MAEQATAPKSNCSHEQAGQFDFWLGEWDLSWGEGEGGTNSITKILDGCVIQERFSSPADGFRGLSVSLYNKRLGEWQQTWVDNQGNYLDFIGGFEDGRMILTRSFEFEGVVIHQRMVWYNIAEDELDWNWERSRDGGKTWDVLWHIRYRRSKRQLAGHEDGD